MSPAEEESLLVIAAHPDDECLGAGGTIAKHVAQGTPVDVLCLTGNEVRNRELRAACRRLGVRKTFVSSRDDFGIDLTARDQVVSVILESRPAAVITHSSDDYNHNHVLCSQVVTQAIEWASHVTLHDDAHRVGRVYFMEVNSIMSHPHVLIDITEYYQTAVAALQEHASQITKAEGFYPRLYDARTRLRGVQGACERAEAFMMTLPEHAGPFYPRNTSRSLLGL
ncbi:MAG: PIG-L family deacetylase [Candidatus Thorarchaeota archaeon]|nr:PIG-L family deacetylase [Candidatus Thorarchaeota archaeon]